MGDHVWKTHAYRELDWNSDPTLARDLSLTRFWFEQGKDNDHELFSPRPGKTIVLENIPEGFCTNSSEPVKSSMKLYISGKFLFRSIQQCLTRKVDWDKDG